MPKIFAVVRGAEVRIGQYGLATETVGVEVPERVAAQLSGNPLVRIERLPAAVVAPESDPFQFTRRAGRRHGAGR